MNVVAAGLGGGSEDDPPPRLEPVPAVTADGVCIHRLLGPTRRAFSMCDCG